MKNKKIKFIKITLPILMAALYSISAANITALEADSKGNNVETKETASAVESIETEQPQQVVYTVKPGDSLYRIADKYNVHIYQVRDWNNLNNFSTLQPGDEITIKHVEYPPYEGMASWYGPNFDGKPMANGQIYDMNQIVVAHRTLPLGTKVKITNLDNGKSIIAPVLDRGPYVKNSKGEYTRDIDLSYGVALVLGTIPKGVVPAKIEPINEPLPN
ncbi:MAG: septal ring lytic transglycosylase RlpA family protein [bacterium]